MDETARLAGWLVLVGLMIAVSYLGRATEGKPDPNVLYQWSTAIGGIIQDGIVLVLVLALAGFSRQLLALRRPTSLRRRVQGGRARDRRHLRVRGALQRPRPPGNEQGLTPTAWQPAHAAAYVVNAIVICTWIPFVEELTYRGLGYSLLVRFGRWPAILAVGILFGLAHGLADLAADHRGVRLRARVDPRPHRQRRPRDDPARSVQPGRAGGRRHHPRLDSGAVRRVALVALFVLALAPSAHAAPCGVTSTRVVGSAPLTVTFTATCASATYAWSFGDGEEGLGASVQHVYGAGALPPDADHRRGRRKPAPVVTAISLKVTAPKAATAMRSA